MEAQNLFTDRSVEMLFLRVAFLSPSPLHPTNFPFLLAHALITMLIISLRLGPAIFAGFHKDSCPWRFHNVLKCWWGFNIQIQSGGSRSFRSTKPGWFFLERRGRWSRGRIINRDINSSICFACGRILLIMKKKLLKTPELCSPFVHRHVPQIGVLFKHKFKDKKMHITPL